MNNPLVPVDEIEHIDAPEQQKAFPPPIKDWTGSIDHRGRHAFLTVGGCGCVACFTAQQSYLSELKHDSLTA